MKKTIPALAVLVILLCGAGSSSLVPARHELLQKIKGVHGLTPQQFERLQEIFLSSPYIGQGNPAITKHPITGEQCRENLKSGGIKYENANFEKICGGKFMAPLYDPKTQKPESARSCIDQFEFPDIPCEYPVIWVKAVEAAKICEALGKRMCDAHEWEGACSGALLEPDYDFSLARRSAPANAVHLMRTAHNRKYEAHKSWSYGLEYQRSICGTGSHKNPGCNGGDWARCGSNTYPTGSFPKCHSPLGVYDLNGNAAEHMNLPLSETQMTSRGSRELGYTEMKGSWFIFDTYQAHEDWCRWRAPYWHGSRVDDSHSHSNYHLGFRCCKTVEKPAQ